MGTQLFSLARKGDIVSGYEFDSSAKEFVKKVDTQEEAIAEVKSIIPRVKEVSKKLDGIEREVKDFVQGIIDDISAV